jgi:riboflavin synthase
MFTGIVECIAEVRSLQRKEALMEVTLSVPVDISDSRLGDSFCVQGACLTAVHLTPNSVRAEVSLETIQRTTLGSFAPGQRVNMERALRLSDPLGGHLVTGHVDGMGRLLQIKRDGPNVGLKFQAHAKVSKYLVEKGSICIDGVSLTVGICEEDSFWTHLIPHTLNQTTLQYLRPGDPVNLEADIIGKYVEKLLAGRGPEGKGKEGISRQFLAKHGFPSS